MRIEKEMGLDIENFIDKKRKQLFKNGGSDDIGTASLETSNLLKGLQETISGQHKGSGGDSFSLKDPSSEPALVEAAVPRLHRITSKETLPLDSNIDDTFPNNNALA